MTFPSASATVARRRTPTSTPTRESGWVAWGCWGRCTSTRTLASSRIPLRRTLIASTRARPLEVSRSIRRVFSCVRTVPITGNVRWRRSGSTRIAPVVKHTRSASRPFFLNRGNPTRSPGPRAGTALLPVPVRVHCPTNSVGVGLFRAFPPPHLPGLSVDTHAVLGLVPAVPHPPKRRLLGLDSGRVPGGDVRFQRRNSPVEGLTAGAEMPCQRVSLVLCRVERELECLYGPAVGNLKFRHLRPPRTHQQRQR